MSEPEKIELCDKCHSDTFYLNDALYPKCSKCGNDLTDKIVIKVL